MVSSGIAQELAHGRQQNLARENRDAAGCEPPAEQVWVTHHHIGTPKLQSFTLTSLGGS